MSVEQLFSCHDCDKHIYAADRPQRCPHCGSADLMRVLFDRDTAAVVEECTEGRCSYEAVQQALFDQEFRRVTQEDEP